MALNLEKQLPFYGSYHRDPVNIGIHMIFVPTILLTSFALASNTPDISVPSWLEIPYFPVNLGSIAAVVYSSLYILMEPVAGGLLVPLLLSATAYAMHLTTVYGVTANYWSLGLHIFSWLAQFVGHGVFEGRAPALTDNLIQAIFLAPFFVWMEVLFFLGYRPELKARLDATVDQEIAKLNASKQPKANGHANGKPS